MANHPTQKRADRPVTEFGLLSLSLLTALGVVVAFGSGCQKAQLGTMAGRPAPVAVPQAPVAPQGPISPIVPVNPEAGPGARPDTLPSTRSGDAEPPPATTRLNPQPESVAPARPLAPQGAGTDGIDFEDGPGLVYTSASGDSLLAIVGRLRSQDRTAGGRFERSIMAADFDITRQGRSASLTLKLRQRQGGLNIVRLDAPVTRISGRVGAQFGAGRDSRALRAVAICVDREQLCQAVVVRVRRMTGDQAETAYIIVRETSARLTYDATSPADNRNMVYRSLVSVLVNSRDHRFEPIEYVRLHTSEVLGGPSAFLAFMKIHSQPEYYGPTITQHLGWEGPLVRRPSGAAIGLPLARMNGEMTIRGRRAAMDGVFANHVQGVELVRNDGVGRLTFRLTMGPSQRGERAEDMMLHYEREHVLIDETLVQF